MCSSMLLSFCKVYYLIMYLSQISILVLLPICKHFDHDQLVFADGQSDSIVGDIENMVRSYIEKVISFLLSQSHSICCDE